jgi:hypothetical protein
MKRIPGIKPTFIRCKISRPDGTVLEAWEMFVGPRSFGRSDSKKALLRSWEARLEEAENGRPFAFRPMQKRMQPGRVGGASRSDAKGTPETSHRGPKQPAPATARKPGAKSVKKSR